MKTIVMKMWLVVAAALTVTLTSCSNDDDNNKSGSDKMTYSAEIEVSDDVLSLATVNLQEYEAVRVRGTCMMRIFYKSLMKALNLGQDSSRIYLL